MYDDNYSLDDVRRLFPPLMWSSGSELARDFGLATAVAELHGYTTSELAALWQAIEDVLDAYAGTRGYIRGSYATGTESMTIWISEANGSPMSSPDLDNIDLVKLILRENPQFDEMTNLLASIFTDTEFAKCTLFAALALHEVSCGYPEGAQKALESFNKQYFYVRQKAETTRRLNKSQSDGGRKSAEARAFKRTQRARKVKLRRQELIGAGVSPRRVASIIAEEERVHPATIRRDFNMNSS